MKFMYINDILLKKISTSIYDEADIRIFIKELVSHLGLDEYLSEISFDYKDPYSMAIYYRDSRFLKIDLDSLIEDANSLYDRDNDEEKILFINVMILLTLVHEVVHMHQASRRNDTTGIYKIISKEVQLLQILSDEEYDEYYIYFSSEREANITSFEAILYLLSTKLKNDALFEYMLDCLTNELLSGYKRKAKKFISPMQVISSRFSKRAFNVIKNEDIYNSLKYGYPVAKEEYDKFKNNSKEIILEKNNLK